MRGLQSFERVQKLLCTFIENYIDLVIAHDEVASVSDFCTKIKIDCGDKNILEGVQHSDDFSKQKRLSFAQRSHSSDSLSSFDLCGINVINPKTDDGVDDISRRRCSTPKSLITPISQSNTNIEYKPVYVNNHRTISIPKSDDEKWQILKHNTSVLNNCNRSSLRNCHNNSNVYCRTTRSHSLLSQSPRICSSRLSLFSGKSFKIDITDTSNDQEVNMNQSMRTTEQENDTVDSTTKSNNIQLNDYGSTSNLSRQGKKLYYFFIFSLNKII